MFMFYILCCYLIFLGTTLFMHEYIKAIAELFICLVSFCAPPFLLKFHRKFANLISKITCKLVKGGEIANLT